MAGERGAQGVNNPDGYFYQLYTLLYCIWHFRSHPDQIEGYEIGNEISGYGAFDDVVLHVKSKSGQRLTFAIQVKNTSGRIDESSVHNPNGNFYVFKYFQSFLKAAKGREKTIPLEQLAEIIIWTNNEIVGELKQKVEPVPLDIPSDVLGPGNTDFPYERYKIKQEAYQSISRDFLQQAHPLGVLVDKFICVMFKKEVWCSNRAAKDYFSVMAKEVIDCNGDESRFKQKFIEEDSTLHRDTLTFRKLFERAMVKKFADLKIGDFQMNKLNCDEYRVYFKLRVDDQFRVCNVAAWKIDGYVPGPQDLEDFFARFVFYVKIPKLTQMERFLSSKYSDFFEQLCKLAQKCTWKKMASNVQINNIFHLLQLREGMCYKIDKNFTFDSDNIKLQEYICPTSEPKKAHQFLYVHAAQDLKCSVARLLPIIVSELKPDGERYLAFDHRTFVNKIDVILSILSDSTLAENGLKYIVIICDSETKENDIVEKFKAVNVKIIFIGCHKKVLKDYNYFNDEFDISALSENTKHRIANITISLFGLSIDADKLFTSTLYRRENFRLVLELYRSRVEIITVGDVNLELDSYFVSRKVQQDAKSSEDVDLTSKNIASRILISDQAGMGKSTEMVNITLKLRKKYQDYAVVLIDCKAAVKYFKGIVADMVCEMISGINELGRLIIKELFNMKKIILLMDGYDEVSEEYNESLRELIKAIDAIKVHRLYIAARPHCKATIKELIPKCATFSLAPFQPLDQLEYLIKFWDLDKIESDDERNIVKEKAEELIKKFRNILGNNSLLGIPQQTYMIAYIYKDEIRSSEFQQPQSHQIGCIFEKFIERKLEKIEGQFSTSSEVLQQAFKKLKASALNDHIRIAPKIYSQRLDESSLALCNELQLHGLIRLEPSVGFTHQTYLEYFLALYYLIYSVEDQAFRTFLKRNFCTSRVSIITKFMDYHIGNIDPSRELQTDLPENSSPNYTEDFTVACTARLHPNKILAFNHYLQKQCTEAEVYTLIRNSFNASVFNVFEVLYDSLPEPIKSQLKLCFGSSQKVHHINLKLMGANQVLQLLNVLKKKNPYTFIRKYLTDFEAEDEDFIDVACRKPFIQVLQWLFELVPENKEERTSLESYVIRRLPQYLKLVVQHNNSQCLQAAIDWVKSTFAQHTVECVLRDSKLLFVFAENINSTCNTKDLIIERRLEMIHSLYEVFSWAFGERVLLNDNDNLKCIDIINKIENIAIKSTLELTFLKKLG